MTQEKVKKLDGTNQKLTFKVKNADELNALLAMLKPKQDGQVVDYWYTGDSDSEPWSGPLTGDITLKAHWVDATETGDTSGTEDNQGGEDGEHVD